MSKTYKDEPLWVKQRNTKRYKTTSRHTHYKYSYELIDGTVEYTRYVRVAVYYEAVTRLVPVFASEFHKYDIEDLKKYLSFNGTSTLYYYEDVNLIKRYKVVPITSHYKTYRRVFEEELECSIDAVEKGKPSRKILCERVVDRWQLGKHEKVSNRPLKYESNLCHRKRRGRYTIENKKLAKMYNSGEDVGSYDYDHLYEPTHEGYWD